MEIHVLNIAAKEAPHTTGTPELLFSEGGSMAELIHVNLKRKLKELGIAMQVMAQHIPPTPDAQVSFKEAVLTASSMRTEIELVGRVSALITNPQAGLN